MENFDNPDMARLAKSSLEKNLWEAADKLRKNIDAAEYKHVVLGLIFLKHVSDDFEALHATITYGRGRFKGADPEDRSLYRSENVFFVPPRARWSFIREAAKWPNIGEVVDEAMELIEKDNPALKGVLSNKVYDRHSLDPACLGGLIALVGDIAMTETQSRNGDLLGHVFEYFLGQFAQGEGKKGGQFYTPRSIVELLVEMLEPYEGKIFDPCCGSGGMFVQTESFVGGRSRGSRSITVFGQESNQTTWRLAKMNLAIRAIDSSRVLWNSEGSFLRDAHPDLKADYILANPPFNDSDWSGRLLRSDLRWAYGKPPSSNANYAWLEHIAHHMAPGGQAGVVLSKGALTSKNVLEYDIRRRMILEGNLMDCVVGLPPKLFLNTQIPAVLLIMSRDRESGRHRPRGDELLFIDARDLGDLVTRRLRVFDRGAIERISGIYHNWRNAGGYYENVNGFCRAVKIGEVAELDFALNPGRFVGLPDDDEILDFEDNFNKLSDELQEHLQEERRLNQLVLDSLDKVRF